MTRYCGRLPYCDTFGSRVAMMQLDLEKAVDLALPSALSFSASILERGKHTKGVRMGYTHSTTRIKPIALIKKYLWPPK